MSITLGEVLAHTRLRHPAFSRENCPNVVLAKALSDYQRYLIRQTAKRDKSIVVDRFSIRLDLGNTTPGALLMTATDFGVVTGVPALRDHTGDGIDLVAGAPVIDAAEDLTAVFEDGLAIPQFVKILGGTAWYSGVNTAGSSNPTSSPVYLGGRRGSDFEVVDYSQRLNPPHFPSGYVLENKLYLCGLTLDWQSYHSIDVRYVPATADLTIESATFRLPDIARDALNAKSDAVAAEWASARGSDVDSTRYDALLSGYEASLLDDVSARHRVTQSLQRTR